MDLSRQSNQELLTNVTALVGSHRELTAKLVAHLAEIEARRLHLLGGFPSMFDFCQKKLGMSEGEAFRRILAARLGRRFPVVFTLIASGAVHLSALELLREHMTEENHEELLEGASRKSKREVALLLAERFPRPDVPSRVLRQSGVEPLSEGRFKVEFTASETLREKLERCRDLMSHANPTLDLAVVVERGIDLLIAELERRRLGRKKRPRGDSALGAEIEPVASGARITSAVRRQVYERDGTRCTYVSPDGRRCEARAFLELDHVVPKAVGGGNDARNVRIRCRAHNQLSAEQAFGREYVEKRMRFRRQKRSGAPGEERAGHGKGAGSSTGVFERVYGALRNLGFRDGEARRAVAEVAAMHDVAPPLEQALREALTAATARAA